MRTYSYVFPSTVSPTVRYMHGANRYSEYCVLYDSQDFRDKCRSCPWSQDKLVTGVCRYYKVLSSDLEISNITKSACKSLLKKFGGTMKTFVHRKHCDSNGLDLVKVKYKFKKF